MGCKGKVRMPIRITTCNQCAAQRRAFEQEGFDAPLEEYPEASYMDESKKIRIFCMPI